MWAKVGRHLNWRVPAVRFIGRSVILHDTYTVYSHMSPSRCIFAQVVSLRRNWGSGRAELRDATLQATKSFFATGGTSRRSTKPRDGRSATAVSLHWIQIYKTWPFAGETCRTTQSFPNAGGATRRNEPRHLTPSFRTGIIRKE